jgi:hypothetical protein|tara:strand:+ start:788 stop:1342 length:555 start_codon:yes stop_codon:yes gene_type:complete
MKNLKKMNLKINPDDMILTMNTDIEMVSKTDKDDAYIVMFNIIDNPLRLSIITVSNFYDIMQDVFKVERVKIESLTQQELDVLIAETVSNIEIITQYGEEKITINLDTETNAKKVRVILSSMIENGFYTQITNYHCEGEVIKKEQKIDTQELNPQLKMMLEIAKDWNKFDINKFKVKAQRLNGR